MSKFTSDINYLRQYVNGELSPTEMYEIERAMHEDEMLLDIIEGLEQEKILRATNPTAEIHANIKARIEKKRTVQIFPIKRWAIAAGIVALLSFGTIYLFNSVDEQNIELSNNTAITPHAEKDSATFGRPKDDSTWIAHVENPVKESYEVTEQPSKNPTNTKKDSPDPKKIMVYAAKPKMQVVIEGPKYLNKEKEEIIHTFGSGQYQQPPTTELLSARANPIPQSVSPSSIAKSQADLQRMNLDPRTKSELMNILSRQSQENKTETTEKLNENLISDILTNGNTLAGKKAAESTIMSSSASETPIPRTIQNGNPTIGWTAFHLYVKGEMKKKGFNSYAANISFDLDSTMKPIHIEIKTSSDPKINTYLIEIIKSGPTWENKDPNHPIFIRIDSEENLN